MNKVVLPFVVSAVLLLLAVSQTISVVQANPWAFSKEIGPPPEAVAPIISINSPKNNTNYSGDFNITFNVKRIQDSNYVTEIARVTYTIDNESFSIRLNGKDVLSLEDYDTSFTAPTLATGKHSLTVGATGIAFNPNTVYFTMDGISQVTFTTQRDNIVDDPTPDKTANPTQRSTDTPTSTTLPVPSPTIPELALESAVSLLVVAVISLVYLQRHKSKHVIKQSKTSQGKSNQ